MTEKRRKWRIVLDVSFDAPVDERNAHWLMDMKLEGSKQATILRHNIIKISRCTSWSKAIAHVAPRIRFPKITVSEVTAMIELARALRRKK